QFIRHYPNSTTYVIFIFYTYPPHRHLHSFPTRRSSDLDSRRRDHDRGTASRPEKFLHAANEHVRIERLGQDAVRTNTTRPLLIEDRKSTRLNSSHVAISYAVFCLKKKKI